MFGDAFINTLRGIRDSAAPIRPTEEDAEKGRKLAQVLGVKVMGRQAAPYRKVRGFEEDAKTYGNVDKDNPRETDALTWKNYSVSSKDGKKAVEKFSVGYDDMGRIAGVRSKQDDGKIYGYYGKDLLKSFFSRFNRDATQYTVWEEKNNGDGSSALVIFDSDNSGAPFIPSDIFRAAPRTSQPATPLPLIPVQDTFTGNLRSTNPGVSSGLNGLR